MKIRGKVYRFGRNIDTDQIYPGRYLELHEPQEIAKHVMEGASASFAAEVRPGDIIVASTNFGCGSSREHAAIALKKVGISVVIAESFACIFYRNCINLGLPLLVCPKVSELVTQGDYIEADLAAGTVKNITQNTEVQGEALSEHIINIIRAGGVKPLFKAKFGQG